MLHSRLCTNVSTDVRIKVPLLQGKWPSAATTPESRTDRNVVSSASFMHMATASHPMHDSPRDPPARSPHNGTRSRSPANVLPMLRRTGDAATRRRPSRNRKTPAVGTRSGSGKLSDRPASSSCPRTSAAPAVVATHLIGSAAAQRGPGRLRSRSSDSTASPQQGAAHGTAGAVSDDTSVTDHVTPEVSGVSVHGEPTSSGGEPVSSLSGPENSLMLLQSVESGGGATAAATAAAATARADDAPQQHAEATAAAPSASGVTYRGHRSASASGATVRPSARRMYHINHTASDGTPLTSPQHLQPPAGSTGPSPRPRSVGPASAVRSKDLSMPLPRLRDSVPRIGGGPDSARDSAGSEHGASEGITDERRYYGYGGRYHLHDVTERGLSPSVSPASAATSRIRAGGSDTRAAAAAATASLTRTRRSSSVRRTPRQPLIPGPPDSSQPQPQSQDSHVHNVLSRLEGPSSSGIDSGRVPIGRQRSGNLFSGAYPKTAASSGGIQACTMDALAAGSAGASMHAVRAHVPRERFPPSSIPPNPALRCGTCHCPRFCGLRERCNACG